MLNNLKINICSIGDPANPSVWSGTPFHIYSELKKREQCGSAFNSDISSELMRILISLSFRLYGEFDLERKPIIRYARAFNSARKTRTSISTHTLHMGTLSLPFIYPPKNQYHYLFCDSTWNLWSRYVPETNIFSEKIISLFNNLEKQSYSQVKHVFSTSHYVKDNLINYYGVPPQKVTVVGTGLGIIKPFNGEKDYSTRKILFAAKGNSTEKKRDRELVVTAFRKVLELEPNSHLTIVGNKEMEHFDNCSNITVLGFVPPEDLQKLFDTHSLFLLPASNQPWGLVYLEAMACKMPIIGLNRNSFPELSGYGQYGFVIDNDNSDVLASVLIAALRNPVDLKEMGESAQTYCLANFSWEKTVDRILQVISGAN